MASYTDLANLAVGTGGLPSGTTVTALRDNPIAIAEGAVGAPKVLSEGLDMFVKAGDDIADYVDLDRVDKVLLFARMDTGTTANYALSSDNGATFGSSTNYSFATVVTLGANNAIRVNNGFQPRAHVIIGVSGVKP